MAFPVPEFPAITSPCLRPTKSSFCDLRDLCFVHPGLEAKVEVREELSLRKPGLFDFSLDPSFDPGVCLDGKQPFKEIGGWQRLLCGIGKLPGQGPSVFPEVSGSPDGT